MEELFNKFIESADEITAELEKRKLEIEQKQAQFKEMDMFSQFNEEYVNAFFKKPYVIIPKKNEEWYMVVPKMFDINVGYQIKSTESYNVFVVNKYANYLGDVPDEFKKIFKFKEKLPLKIFNGVVLTGEKHQETTWSRYRNFLSNREGKDRIKINKRKRFAFIAQLINDGILPFMPKPVEQEHHRESSWIIDIEEINKRKSMKFFLEAKQKFLETGAIGVYWAMGVGKTIFGLELLSMINVDNKPNLVISGNSATLREQWIEKLDSVNLASNVEVHTYHAWNKVKDREWGLAIFDECHHLPANTFSKLSTLKVDYRVGLSATPYREDGRTDYIFALTGFPVGLNWKVLLELGMIKAPDITLFMCSDYRAKEKKVIELAQDTVKTLIYSFSIAKGKSLSNKLEVPFVHGATPIKQRKEIIDNSQTIVISSVGKEGLSIQDIERTISYDFHFGSRQEETQFFGRLLHGKEKGEHFILMTDEEFTKYGKRLYGIQEKGFKIRTVRV